VTLVLTRNELIPADTQSCSCFITLYHITYV